MPDEGKHKTKTRARSKEDESEGPDLADIMAELKAQGQTILTRLDGIDGRLNGIDKLLDSPLEVERAHRTLRLPPPPGRPPRPILIRFLRFRDRELVLNAAKKSNQLREGDAKLTLRQDLSAEVRRRRKEFSEVTEYFIREGMFRGFAYPHRLRILHRGSIVFLDNPGDAKVFIKKLEERQAES
ncbi:hypothetical protein WMY93_010533 [Mugilogobius chulae]|uniref:LINE-1 type transposase domain-containing protein 1 n=1 Tax=Mugilogobius chulae TaxID=88201 RepID=A0AAW0PGM3_9GOBI